MFFSRFKVSYFFPENLLHSPEDVEQFEVKFEINNETYCVIHRYIFISLVYVLFDNDKSLSPNAYYTIMVGSLMLYLNNYYVINYSFNIRYTALR